MKIAQLFIIALVFIKIKAGEIAKSNCPMEGTYCIKEEQALGNCTNDTICQLDLQAYEESDEIECMKLMQKNLISECE